ncbi:MAG: rhomboid-like protein [Thermomicrobiales bacterium]
MKLLYALPAIPVALYATRTWGPTARALAWWETRRPFVLGYLRSGPAVVTYAVVLFITTTIYEESGTKVQAALLQERSTNLHHLARDPIHVLISSAFWTGDDSLIKDFILFALILIPLERWIGTLRFLLVFWTGHIGTTLVVDLAIRIAIDRGHAAPNLAHVIDVGVSYGLYCCCALFIYRFRPPLRALGMGGLLVYAGYGIRTVGDFTAYGHFFTILLGFALYPVTRFAGAKTRLAEPIWRPTASTLSPSPSPSAAD